MFPASQWAAGHFWTLADHVRDRVRPFALVEQVPWQTTLSDPDPIELTGWLRHSPDRDRIAVIVHGLGGSADSGYVMRMTAAAQAAGFATLRLHLRGADRRGHGIYHAGLGADVLAALASDEVTAYRKKYVIGFSMGGHVSLRAIATQPGAADAVVSLCAPLDLEASCHYIDHPLRSLYRWHVLSGLKEIYGGYAARRGISVSPVIKNCQRLYDWDQHVVAPHFGFASANDYYQKMSVAPLLKNIQTKTLVIAVRRDPMVPESVVGPHLVHASSNVTVDWVEGGHVGFPPRVAIWSRICSWLPT